MHCKNPLECKRKYMNWKPTQENSIQIGEEILEKIVKNMERGIDLTFSNHADKRSLFRSFSINDVREAILNGWVIEYDEKRKTILVLYNIKVAAGKYRPIHVVIGFNEKAKIVTCYDPRSKAWKWDKNFQERNCFCKD